MCKIKYLKNFHVTLSLILSLLFLVLLITNFNKDISVISLQPKELTKKKQVERKQFAFKPVSEKGVMMVNLPLPPVASDSRQKTLQFKPVQKNLQKIIKLKPIIPNKRKSSEKLKKIRSLSKLTVDRNNTDQEKTLGEVKSSPKGRPIKTYFKSLTKSQNLNQESTTKSNGRSFLRLLENGKGPVIEIAWPQTSSSRQKLFEYFSRCYGMRTALIDKIGHLFVADGVPGKHWSINLDYYSGYVRKAGGVLANIEKAEERKIRTFHGKLFLGSAVRLFPRKVDSLLLGRLHQLAGKKYGNIHSIRATYVLRGNQVSVEHIVVDGIEVRGQFYMPPEMKRCLT